MWFPQAHPFALALYPIPFRGDATGLDQHYRPRRGKAGTSVLSFFAQEHESQVVCYANEGSGQIRAKIYAKALPVLLQRDTSKIRRVFHTELM